MTDYYLVEGIIEKLREKRNMKENIKANSNEMRNKQIRYLQYQQQGGALSIENFEDKEMLQYEKDHNKNPKLYPNFKIWKKRKMKEKIDNANIEEKISKNKKRFAQAKHEESIAKMNDERVKKMKKENLL